METRFHSSTAGEISGRESVSAQSKLLRLKTILVPVDLSPCSRSALRFAAALAAKMQAELTVLHVREIHISGSWEMDLARTMVSLAEPVEKRFREFVRKEIPPDLHAKTLLLSGSPAQQILETARKNEFDLIVLGSHGRTGWEHARLGSVAEHVVRLAPCPVLVLPAQRKEAQLA